MSAITKFVHPFPQLKTVHKELVFYTRGDGVQLTAYLYLPHKDAKNCDTILWACKSYSSDNIAITILITITVPLSIARSS